MRWLIAHPASSDARKICFLIIKLDQQIVYEIENKVLLNEFLSQLATDMEIYSISGYWPSSRTPVELSIP